MSKQILPRIKSQTATPAASDSGNGPRKHLTGEVIRRVPYKKKQNAGKDLTVKTNIA